ncbi:hypothetical protein KSP40_PGU021094 [Platanthera guangdongensis]|uniref:Myb/SANT-like domain-containing protein n=1 Tax=Platanthera guangdongensis TaxID=2320717 RepID=A0ABR2M5R4_9ASPA
MGKSKEGVISANWETPYVLRFCDHGIQEIDSGNRPTTHFNKEDWNNLVKNFKERTGQDVTCL